MAYTQQRIATMVFQKATGRADEVDLQQLNDNTVRIFNTQYPMFLGLAMQMRTWRWTNRIEKIDTKRLVESDDARYQYKIKQPEHMKVYDGVYSDDECNNRVDARAKDKYIYINFQDKDNPVGFLQYVSEPAEAIMPDYFVAWFVHFLAVNMIMEIAGDTQRLGILNKLSDDLLKVAQAADNKAYPRQKIPTNVFVSVRN